MNYPTSYPNTDEVASSTWSDPVWDMDGYQYTSNIPVRQSTYAGPMSNPGYLSTVGSYVPNFNAVNQAAFSTIPTEMGSFSLPMQANLTNQNLFDPWSMPGPSNFDANCAITQPQLVGDRYWTGTDPFAAYSSATTNSGVSSAPTTSTYEDEWAWLDNYLPSSTTIPASSPGYGAETGWNAPEQGASMYDVMTSSAGGNASGISWPIPAVPGDVTSNMTTSASAVALGKRRREAEQPLGNGGPLGTQSDEIPRPKQASGGRIDQGIPKAAGSTTRTRRKPVARILKQRISSIPEEAGRGAEGLASPNSQGLYHQSSMGPSFQQGWSVDAADGKPTRVEGRVDEDTVHHTDGTVQKQKENPTELFRIPSLEPDQLLLLQTTDEDLVREAVEAIKCRLCPNARLKDFEEFKRHYRTAERHPQDLHYCDHCGDFFARSDSLTRHCRHRPPECLRATPESAAKKRSDTNGALKGILDQMLAALRAGREVPEGGFAGMMLANIPASESSKKRKRRKK